MGEAAPPIAPPVALAPYLISGAEEALTPALAIYAEALRTNIETTLRLLAAPPQWSVESAPPAAAPAALRRAAARWRPHVKTAKLAATMRELVASGVTRMKCATTLELRVACEAGAEDVLVAFPYRAAGARRIVELARQFPRVRVSVLAESADDVDLWAGTPVGLFWDLNPGMDRTGAPLDGVELLAATRQMRRQGTDFRGLHYYDGHLGALPLAERIATVARGYEALLALADEMRRGGETVEEVITAGTPALPGALAFAGWRDGGFRHTVSPGTVVYSDATSLEQLPEAWDYRPAALVLARVVSRPTAAILTCDAGHKAISADCGVPTCYALGHEELAALRPSEEHQPLAIAAAAAPPPRGALLYLLPRHVCPTVNNFDHALWIEAGRIARLEPVSARGHEATLLGAAAGF